MMHPHRNGEQRIALILTIMAITSGISWASMQCKMVVMDVHMRRCRLGAGPRTKKTVERFDFRRHEEEAGPDGYPDTVNDSESHGVPQKRQLTLGRIALPRLQATNEVGTSRPAYYDPDLASGEDLGLDLNNEELEELYNDIYERPPRASKEEAWKAFLETASKCCQNIDRCKREETYVLPCLAI